MIRRTLCSLAVAIGVEPAWVGRLAFDLMAVLPAAQAVRAEFPLP